MQRSRSFVRKLTDYLAMLIVTPLFVVVATALSNAGNPELQASSGLAGFLQSAIPIEAVRTLLLDWAPLVVIWFAFTFLYMVLPNAPAKFASVALGGVVAGSLWLFVQELHVRFQLGVKNYNVIYAGFAFFPIFMVWINVSWAVVLFGAELAAAHQSEPAYRYLARAAEMTQSLRELVALRATTRVVRAFLAGEPAPTAFELAGAIGLPLRSTEEVLHELVEHGILASSQRDADRVLLPARDPDTTHVGDVLDVLRGRRRGRGCPRATPWIPRSGVVWTAWRARSSVRPTTAPCASWPPRPTRNRPWRSAVARPSIRRSDARGPLSLSCEWGANRRACVRRPLARV